MSQYCSKCGTQLDDDAVFCTSCGHQVGAPVVVVKEAASEKVSMINKFANKVDAMAGGEGNAELRFKDLFSEVFTKHGSEEAEELFICGTSKTTPEETSISDEWPKPWLFSRVFLGLLVAYGLLYALLMVFENILAIPGIIFMGSIAAPFSVLVFFFEINAPRNISIFQTVSIFLIGGCLSLIITMCLYMYVDTGSMSIVSAILIGVIEEIGKIVTTAIFIKRLNRCKYIFNGMLIGAAVGAGFAAFESAGYAFEVLLGAQLFKEMTDVILLRGILSPGGHVAWAAIEGAAIIISLNGAEFSWNALFDKHFLSLSIICVVLHAIWDMPIFIGGILVYGKLAALVVVAWITLIVLINRGLKQINKGIAEA
ncbi:PrsW family glutamic-type intramembrane protease [Lachnospiraceae bacterium C1.1]|nr:PrsW family intramembrane metalloprotease [Lachnospiraceae bacterium C1.1]